jgi:hypothetical protein
MHRRQLCLVHGVFRDPGSTDLPRASNRIVLTCPLLVTIRPLCRVRLRRWMPGWRSRQVCCVTRYGCCSQRCAGGRLAVRWRCGFLHTGRFNALAGQLTPEAPRPTSSRPIPRPSSSSRPDGPTGRRRSRMGGCGPAERGRTSPDISRCGGLRTAREQATRPVSQEPDLGTPVANHGVEHGPTVTICARSMALCYATARVD